MTELNRQTDQNDETALIRCAFEGDEKTMRYLLEDLELDIKQTGQYGRNVFHNAVLNKNHGIQMAKLINEKDGELKFQKDDNGDTALTLCAWLGDVKTMKYLLEDLKLDIKQTGSHGQNVLEDMSNVANPPTNPPANPPANPHWSNKIYADFPANPPANPHWSNEIDANSPANPPANPHW